MPEEFTTAGTLEVEVDQQSLREAQREIESELGGASVGVDVGGSGAAMRAGGGRSLGDIKEAIDNIEQLAGERNELLEQILDELEEGLGKGGGGGGGLPFPPLFPFGDGGGDDGDGNGGGGGSPTPSPDTPEDPFRKPGPGPNGQPSPPVPPGVGQPRGFPNPGDIPLPVPGGPTKTPDENPQPNTPSDPVNVPDINVPPAPTPRGTFSDRTLGNPREPGPLGKTINSAVDFAADNPLLALGGGAALGAAALSPIPGDTGLVASLLAGGGGSGGVAAGGAAAAGGLFGLSGLGGSGKDALPTGGNSQTVTVNNNVTVNGGQDVAATVKKELNKFEERIKRKVGRKRREKVTSGKQRGGRFNQG